MFGLLRGHRASCSISLLGARVFAISWRACNTANNWDWRARRARASAGGRLIYTSHHLLHYSCTFHTPYLPEAIGQSHLAFEQSFRLLSSACAAVLYVFLALRCYFSVLHAASLWTTIAMHLLSPASLYYRSLIRRPYTELHVLWPLNWHSSTYKPIKETILGISLFTYCRSYLTTHSKNGGRR